MLSKKNHHHNFGDFGTKTREAGQTYWAVTGLLDKLTCVSVALSGGSGACVHSTAQADWKKYHKLTILDNQLHIVCQGLHKLSKARLQSSNACCQTWSLARKWCNNACSSLNLRLEQNFSKNINGRIKQT